MRVSLDSDAYSRLVRGDESVGNPVRDADEVLMSAVVVGELLAGFRNGTRFETNYAELQSILAAPGVSLVVIGPGTLRKYNVFAQIERATYPNERCVDRCPRL